MTKIKVYLQYPWMFPDSPYYKYLINNPPEGIEYINVKKQKGVITNKKLFFLSKYLKKEIRRIAGSLKLPLVNAHLTRTSGGYDVIHCAHCLSLNKNKPWVADFESRWQFFISGEITKKSVEKIKKIILKKNCKKIIFWTGGERKRMIEIFPEIEYKTEVIYPAVPRPKIKKKKHKGINLLFVGRYFEAKGGPHALEAINVLTNKHENVKGIVVSEVPNNIKNKYSQNKKIEFYGLIPQEKLFREIFSKADIFVYPGYSDTFGFSMLESMSFGTPVITVDGISKREIIDNGKTGFVIKSPKIKWKKGTPLFENERNIVKGLIDKTDRLIKNKRLRGGMSKRCVKVIEKGKFSIKERNKRLEKIYSGALK